MKTFLALLFMCVAFSAQADMSIVVKKQAREVDVLRDGKVIKTYQAALGFTPVGTKLRQGDGKTPEGQYVVRVKNAASQFHLSLGIDYPNADDAKRGLDSKLISNAQYKTIVSAIQRGRLPPQNTALGGNIFIHGGGTGRDWTFGCVALSNTDIEELFAMTTVGTKVDIRP